MMNIHKELEIIDDELKALKRYLKKNEDDKNSELREVATRIISERFEKDICKIIGCSIDLREVYVLLSEIYIKFNRMKEEEIIQQINNLTVKLRSASDITVSDIEDANFILDESCIGNKYIDIAKLIYNNIESWDIFWVYLFIIYKKLNQSSDNSKAIGDLSSELMEKYKGLSDDVVLINDDEDIDLEFTVNRAISYAAEDINKISFFSNVFCMKEIKKCVRNRLLELEELFEKHPEVIFHNNEESIVIYIYISIMITLKEKINQSRLEKYDFKKMCNDYQLQFSDKETKMLKKDLMDLEQLDDLILCFGEEN